MTVTSSQIVVPEHRNMGSVATAAAADQWRQGSPATYVGQLGTHGAPWRESSQVVTDDSGYASAEPQELLTVPSVPAVPKSSNENLYRYLPNGTFWYILVHFDTFS